MIHARGQAQGDVAALLVLAHQLAVRQQVHEGVGEALGLQALSGDDLAASSDDAVTGTHQRGLIQGHGPRAVLELARKALVQAAEVGGAGVAQVHIAEQPPQGDGRHADQRVLDLAQPAHQQSRKAPGNAVGEQEIDVLLLYEAT